MIEEAFEGGPVGGECWNTVLEMIELGSLGRRER